MSFEGVQRQRDIERKLEEEKRSLKKKFGKDEKPDTIGSGAGDVEKSIDTSHLDTLEREQKREILQRVEPIRGTADSIERSRFRRGLTAQAGGIEATVAQQDTIFADNMAQVSKTLSAVKDRPAGEKVVIVDTPEGPKELTKREYQGFVRDYVDRYNTWRSTTTGAVSELGAARKTLFAQASDYARNVTNRQGEIKQAKQNFNQRMLNATAGATSQAGDKPLSKFEERFGVQGIPGPGAGPRPGSFGDRLQSEFGRPASERVLGTFEAIEKPFVSITSGPRRLADRWAEEAAEQEASYFNLMKWTASVGLNVAAGSIDVATIGVRPGLAIQQIKSVSGLAFDPEKRMAAIRGIAADPVRFAFEAGGSIAFGSALKGALDISGSRVKALATDRGPIFRAARAGYSFDGVRGAIRSAVAVEGRLTSRLDFSQLLKEEIALYEFPSETLHAEPFEIFTKFKAREIKPQFQRMIDPFDFRIDSTRGEFTRLGSNGAFVRTGGDIMSIQVPDSMTVPRTLFKKGLMSLVEPSGRPRIPISIPRFFQLARKGFSTQLAISSVISAIPKQKLKSRVPQVQRVGTLQQNMQRFNQSLAAKTRNIMAPPKGLSAIAQIPKQIQPQIQRQRQPTMQRLRFDLPQIQIPGFDPSGTPPRPTPSFFRLPPTPRGKSAPLLDDFLKKKKKKGSFAKKVKGIFELRTAPLGFISPLGKKRKKKKKTAKSIIGFVPS